LKNSIPRVLKKISPKGDLETQFKLGKNMDVRGPTKTAVI